jgi:dolichol-phosphate mannosyltransferase
VIYILLPAYNEAENIRALLEDINGEAPKWFPEGTVSPLPVQVVVVNDGSSDATGAEVEAFTGRHIEVVQFIHEQNRGLAAALNTGIGHICRTAKDSDMVITMDADRTHPPLYIHDLLNQLRAGFDIVVASRYAPGGHEYGVSTPRLILSRGARICYKMFFPQIPLHDFSCGFRGFKAQVLRDTCEQWGNLLFETQGFACTGELMLKMIPNTTSDKVTEIPFDLHYERKGGTSKMPALITIVNTLKLLFQARKWQRKGEDARGSSG